MLLVEETTVSLDATRRTRFERQIALPEIGEEGQETLAASSTLVIGAGGLGSPAALYLTAAGVGRIGLVDSDRVELSNLQRQILHTENDITAQKVDSAQRSLIALDASLQLTTYPTRLTSANAVSIVSEYDFVVDATDNFDSKFLIADTCHQTGTPYSHAGINGFTGQTMTVLPGATACYRCVFEAPPPPQNQPTPVLGAIAGLIGCVQAAEAIKMILHIGTPLTNRLMSVDALTMVPRVVRLNRSATCPLCSEATEPCPRSGLGSEA